MFFTRYCVSLTSLEPRSEFLSTLADSHSRELDTDSIKSALDAIVVLAHSHRRFFKFQLFADFSLSRPRQCWSETWREGWKLKTFFSSSSVIVLCGDYMRNLFGSFSFSLPPPLALRPTLKITLCLFFRHRTKRNLSRRLANPKVWVGQKGTIKNQMIDGHQSKKYVRETHRHVRAHNTAASWRQPTVRCSREFCFFRFFFNISTYTLTMRILFPISICGTWIPRETTRPTANLKYGS